VTRALPSDAGLKLLVAAIAVVFGMGPTVGDVGSCGQTVEDLDPVTFFEIKAGIDCLRCNECGLATEACDVACHGALPTAFPPRCKPLVHDGEVCLNALQFASCGTYASYVSDAAPTAPSECQFCPLP
jgi:hypothetical protein